MQACKLAHHGCIHVLFSSRFNGLGLILPPVAEVEVVMPNPWKVALATAFGLIVLALAGRAAAQAQQIDCSSPDAFPTPECTGVPPGTELKVLKLNEEGAYRVTTDGTVIDGRHIEGDLVIAADHVVIRNSLIDGTVTNDVADDDVSRSFEISWSTIGPAEGCIVSPGVGESRYVADHVRIQGHDDGFRVTNNGTVRVQNSYAKLCARPQSHSDGIQAVCGRACHGVVFDHNTVDARGVDATFMINLTDKHVGEVTVSDNLLMGGAYVVVTHWRAGPKWVVKDNRIVNNAWAYGPASAEGTCAKQRWSGNTLVRINKSYKVIETVDPLPCID
jgi:hypothetical protein